MRTLRFPEHLAHHRRLRWRIPSHTTQEQTATRAIPLFAVVAVSSLMMAAIFYGLWELCRQYPIFLGFGITAMAIALPLFVFHEYDEYKRERREWHNFLTKLREELRDQSTKVD